MKFQQNSKGQPESLQQSAMERLTQEDFHSRMCQTWRWSLRKTSGCTKYPTLPFNNIPGIKQRRNTDLAYSQIPIQLTGRLADSLGPSPSNFYHRCTQQNLTLAGWRVAQVNNISIHREQEPNKNLLSRVHKALPVTHPGAHDLYFHMTNHAVSTAKLHHTLPSGRYQGNQADATVWVAKGSWRRNSTLTGAREIISERFLYSV